MKRVLFHFCLLWPVVAVAQEEQSEPSAAATLVVSVESSEGDVLDDLIVYAESLDNLVLAMNQQPVIIGQNNKAFVPYITVAQKGSAVTFANDDNITHHIYSAVGDNKFSIKIRSGESHTEEHFDQAGVVPMGCNIHDWMGGYLLVVDTPIYGKTSGDGQATLKIPQAGRYRVSLWHPQMHGDDQAIHQDIEVTGDNHLSFTLSKPLAPIPVQENPEDFDFLSDY